MLSTKLLSRAILAVLLFSSTIVFANPTLTLRPSKAIVIERQDVKVTPTTITTQYLFQNHFVLDLFETLTFDLPENDKIEILIDGRPFTPKTLTWQNKKIAYWSQKFPATKTVHIKHVQTIDAKKATPMKKTENTICQNLEGPVNGLKGESVTVHYAFSDSTPWATPIKKFTLQIQAPGSAKPIVCWNQKLEKRTPTLLMFSAENFVPTNGVDIFYR